MIAGITKTTLIYALWGIFICALFLNNTSKGAEFFGSGTTGSKPTGGSGGHYYHK